MSERSIRAVRLGRTEYAEAWQLQRRLFAERAQGRTGDWLLLTEHDHVYTLGTSGEMDHLLAGPEELASRGAQVYTTDRGGDITYHGPGQLVGYPILDLHAYYLDLHRYLRDLEEVIIRTLAGYGITAGREPDFTGVWVGGNKIAAIGVKASRWITMHGFALNVGTDLTYFDRIIPCGIFHKGVTSMEQLLGVRIDLDEVAARTSESFAEVFGAGVSAARPSELPVATLSHSTITEHSCPQ
jgi:lipoate-protein ligase B